MQFDRVGRAAEKLEDATFEMQLVATVVEATSQPMPRRDPLRPLMDIIYREARAPRHLSRLAGVLPVSVLLITGGPTILSPARSHQAACAKRWRMRLNHLCTQSHVILCVVAPAQANERGGRRCATSA